MGVNVSKQMTKSTTDIVNNVLNDISTNIKNGVSTKSKSSQEMYLDVSGVKIDSITMSQKASTSVSSILQANNNMMNDISTQLTTKLKEEITNQLEQANKKLNLGQANIGVQDVLSDTAISNYIKTSISQTIEDMVTTDVDQKQFIKLHVTDSEVKTINLSQEQQISIIAQNMATNIVANTLKAVVTSDIEKKLEEKAKQLNDGVDLNFIFGAVIAIVVVIAGIYMSLKSGGAKSIANDAAVGFSNGIDPNLKNKIMNASTSGGAISKYKQAFLVGLSGFAGIGGFYTLYYLPKKQEIIDDYGKRV